MQTIPTDPDTLRDQVRKRYAAAVTTTTTAGCCGAESDLCCDATGAIVTDEQRQQFGNALYTLEERGELPAAAVLASPGMRKPDRDR
ncbi:MAG: hypothetical protein WAL22_04725 [Solirubrobacteraceae bacterium]